MRIRTAVWIGVGFVAAKAVLTGFALTAWTAIPTRRWAPPHWHVELGALAEWLAAGASAGAAIIALTIATRDRRDRTREREEREKTEARLVRLRARPTTGSPIVSVEVRNHGSMPILNVELVDATWTEHRESRWGTNGSLRVDLVHEMIVPETEENKPLLPVRYHIWFMHPTDETPLAEVAVERTDRTPRQYVPIDLSNVEIRIRFRTANGVRWETPTLGAGTGEPVRL